jgi:hypothetical protein
MILNIEASSRYEFYGLRCNIETLVWLHCCLDGYSCLFCGEFLMNSWYGCCDVDHVGLWSEKHSYDLVMI